MSQQIQELIDKIKSEGVDAAQQKAKEIEEQAKKNAQEIISQAKKEAQQMLMATKEDIKKLQESTHMALKQAARDTVLQLRKAINDILKKLISQEVATALTPEHLAKIIETVVKNSSEGKGDIRVVLSKEDLEKLRNGALSKLQAQLKKEVTFAASGEQSRGFTISFDGGRSSFDFSDQSLADYLSSFVNEEIASLIKEIRS